MDGREPPPRVPSDATLTRSVTPVSRSWTRTSSALFVSPLTRLEAKLPKATKRPSAEMDGLKEPSLPWVPSDATLTRSVTPVRRSCTKTSEPPLVSPLTRLEAKLSKATKRPSAEMDGLKERSLLWVTSDATLTRSVTPLRRSRTKMSGQLPGPQRNPQTPQRLVSSGTRLEATLAKATKRASAEMDRPRSGVKSSPTVASEATLAGVVVWRATAPAVVRENTRALHTTALR